MYRKLRVCLVAGIMILLAGCGTPHEVNYSVPFSSLTWGDSCEKMKEAESGDAETYESIYGGDTYVYPKEYQGYAGHIKYMYDKEGRLVSIAWLYSSENLEELQELYDRFHGQIVEEHGESEYAAQHSTNYGDAWHLKGGDIVLSVMTTEEQRALQYCYMSPEVSSAE